MNTPAIAGSPVLWIGALAVFAVIGVQSFVYLRAPPGAPRPGRA